MYSDIICVLRNPRVSCDSLPRINLDLWKDRADCQTNGKEIQLGSALRVSPCVMCTCTKEGVKVVVYSFLFVIQH